MAQIQARDGNRNKPSVFDRLTAGSDPDKRIDSATGVKVGDKNLQFPTELGDDEYNQFILFTTYSTAGAELRKQQRAEIRELTGEIDFAKEENIRLVGEELDKRVLQSEANVVARNALNRVFGPVAGNSMIAREAAQIQLTRDQIELINNSTALEVRRLTTERKASTQSLEIDDTADTFIDSLDTVLDTGKGADAFRNQFMNDRSINTVEQAQKLGLDVANRADIPNRGSGRIRLGAATKKSDVNIALYIPNKLVNNGSIGYNGVNFELLQAAGGVGKSIIDAARNFGDGDTDSAIGDIKGIASRVSGLGARALARIADGLAGVVGVPLNATEGLQQVTGLVINPRQQQVFQGVATRGFDFTFSFAPKNQKEAVEVSNIIRAFRKAAHPSLAAKAFLDLPSEFEIRYYKVHENGVVAENLFLNKIGRCALRNVNVDFTPNGVNATFEDGSPVRTSLTLQFTELRPLTKEDIEEGY